MRKFRSEEVKRLRSWTEEVRKWRGEVTNLKRNSSLTAVNRCKNPNLQKRLGFSFCTFQVLKWRSGLTRVVSTYTYAVSSIHNKCLHPFKASSPSDHNHSKEHDTVSWGGFNLHICRLPIRNKQYHPKFGSNPQEVHGGGCRREEEVHERSNAIGVQSIESWPIRNRYPPSHTLGSIPSEHGAFALGKAAQSCATHGEANRWGSRIYGELVSSSHVVPKPQSLSFAFTAHSPWTVCLWGGEQPTGWCWCNVVSSVILILYRQRRWLYTITQIVCQVQSETMIVHFEYELSGHSVGGCDRLCSRLRNRL